MSTFNRRRFLGTVSAASLAGPAIVTHALGADAPQFSYKFGHSGAIAHPLNVAIVKACTQIREQTGGRVAIEVFPNSQLGGDTDMLSQVRSGAMQFMSISPLILSNLVPGASISGVGFCFSSYDQVWGAMDGELGAYVKTAIAKAGLVPMEKMYDNGFRQLTTGSKPIRTADDLKGLKIRVPVSPLWTSLFTALGASPVSINFADAYIAMQSKVVDGQENALGTVALAKLYEVQKACAKTNHIWDGMWFIANPAAWNKMPADARAICAKAFADQAAPQRETNQKLNDSLQAELESRGMVFTSPDLNSFKAAARRAGFYSEWKQKFGPELWSLLEKHVGVLA